MDRYAIVVLSILAVIIIAPPPASGQRSSEEIEELALRLHCEKTWPVIQEVVALADLLDPEIDRVEAKGETFPGFITGQFSCQDDVVRLMRDFAQCKGWATLLNDDAVAKLSASAEVSRRTCTADLRTLRNQ